MYKRCGSHSKKKKPPKQGQASCRERRGIAAISWQAFPPCPHSDFVTLPCLSPPDLPLNPKPTALRSRARTLPEEGSSLSIHPYFRNASGTHFCIRESKMMLILVSTRHHVAKLLCRIAQSELLRLLMYTPPLTPCQRTGGNSLMIVRKTEMVTKLKLRLFLSGQR